MSKLQGPPGPGPNVRGPAHTTCVGFMSTSDPEPKGGLLLRWNSISAANRRLIVALVLYALLIAVALVALQGFLRTAVLFFLILLVIKTLAHSEQQGMD